MSGTWMTDAPVLCAGHQRILVVGAINGYRRYWRTLLSQTHQFVAEQVVDSEIKSPWPTVWMPPLTPINKDSANPGAAIVEGEGEHAGIVAWVDALGQDMKIRALRLPSMTDWRRVAPYRVTDALVTLMREIKALGAAECQERDWWTVRCPDGKYRPCEKGVPGYSADLVRWEHAWRHGKDPAADDKLVTAKNFKRIADRVTDLGSMLDEVDRLSP